MIPLRLYPQVLLDKLMVTGAGCLEYDGQKQSEGYGHVWFDRSWHLVHRVAWKHFYGDIPQDVKIRQRCDNRRCFRIEHLMDCTQKGNMAIRDQRGRAPVGERNGRSKLSAQDVIEMRRMFDAGVGPCEVGRQFGIDKTTARAIRDFKLWKHVK